MVDSVIKDLVGLKPTQKKFLAAYAQTFSVVRAAQLSGVSRKNHYYWLKTNPEYREAFKQCVNICTDKLLGELYERAFDRKDAKSVTAIIYLLNQLKPNWASELVDISAAVAESESDFDIARDLEELLDAYRRAYDRSPTSATIDSGDRAPRSPAFHVPNEEGLQSELASPPAS